MATDILTLLKCANYDEPLLLATVQAYIIYSIHLLFNDHQTPRTHKEDQQLIISLQEISFQLAATGLILDEESDESPTIRPSWSDWILFAAKRRAVLLTHIVIWVWSFINDYPPFDCREIYFMPSTCEKTLWQARTEDEWGKAYLAWKERWGNKPHTIDDVQDLVKMADLGKRTNRFLEEVDEFGMLLAFGCKTALRRIASDFS